MDLCRITLSAAPTIMTSDCVEHGVEKGVFHTLDVSEASRYLVVINGIIFSVEILLGRALLYCSQRHCGIYFNDEISFEQCARKIRSTYI